MLKIFKSSDLVKFKSLKKKNKFYKSYNYIPTKKKTTVFSSSN